MEIYVECVCGTDLVVKGILTDSNNNLLITIGECKFCKEKAYENILRDFMKSEDEE